MGSYTLNGKNYTDSDLMRIGQNVASLWGGGCIEFEINQEEGHVDFDCIEHGERFFTSLKFDELNEYDY